MRALQLLTCMLPALLVCAAAAHAAPGDPYVIYTSNTYTGGAVILRTDPATGSVAEISRNGSQGTLFTRPIDLAVQSDGSLVVADMGAPNRKDGSVIRVDPRTGRQTLVSSGGAFFDPAAIAVAPGGDLYVVDNLAPDNDGGVIRVDPTTGAQTVVSRRGQGGALFDLPFSVAVDRDGSLVVVNRVSPAALTSCVLLGSVIRVDPSTGAQRAVSTTPGSGNLLGLPLGAALAQDGTIFAANECPLGAGIVRVEPHNGQQGTVTPNGPQDVLVTPERIALDPAGALLVTDFALGADGDGGIVRVDPATGAQALLRHHELFDHPMGIAAVVNRPPVAALSASPQLVAAGRPVKLDGSGSSDPEGLRLFYEWDLDGDGRFEAASGPTSVVTHTFSRDGPVGIGVRVSDPHGGKAVARTEIRVDGSVPRITRVRLDDHRLGVGPAGRGRHRGAPPRATRLRFRLSEAARVTVGLSRARAGRRAGGACRPRARSGRRCVVWKPARRFRRAGRAGANAIRVRARGLRPGRYRLTLTAADRAGNVSVERRLALRVVRLRR